MALTGSGMKPPQHEPTMPLEMTGQIKRVALNDLSGIVESNLVIQSSETT